jgi:N-acylneuraminate cytidylyltransferase
MIEGQSVLAVVPARGGSKGIPNKNIHPVAGRPLLAWTLDAARATRYLDRTVVSSDSDHIIEVARSLGADVPFVRPAELACDDTPGIDPVLHALAELPQFDVVVLLQPTSPLRTSTDIDAAIELLLRSGAMSCVSVTEAINHPYWTYRMSGADMLAPFIELPQNAATRRQDLPRAFALNGAVYVARVPWVRESRTFLGPNTVGYEMPAGRAIDIDLPDDLAAAERALLGLGGPKPRAQEKTG